MGTGLSSSGKAPPGAKARQKRGDLARTPSPPSGAEDVPAYRTYLHVCQEGEGMASGVTVIGTNVYISYFREVSGRGGSAANRPHAKSMFHMLQYDVSALFQIM